MVCNALDYSIKRESLRDIFKKQALYFDFRHILLIFNNI